MIADWVVVGAMLIVVRPVVVVVVVLVVVGSAVVVGTVVVVEATVVEAAVVVGAVVVGAVVVLGVVTGGWVVAPGVEWVLVTVVLLRGGASGVAYRPPMVIGRLAADGLVSGLTVDGEDAVVGSVVVLVVLVVRDVGTGSAVVVGRATPGARCGAGAWGGNRVAEATRAARTAKGSPKATSRSLQGRRGLARCRGRWGGMCIVPVRQLLPGEGAPGGGAVIGHIGRSLAERIEWRVRVHCRPTPPAHPSAD